MTETVTLNIDGRKVKVGREFLDLSPEEQNRTVEEIAAALPPGQVMARFNQGVAEGVGGLVDFLNPFDRQMGSAQDGLRNMMEAGGIEVGEGDPETNLGRFGRGAGSAAAAAVPVGLLTRGLSTAGGLLGSVADDAAQAMNTGRGFLAELAAGGAASSASGAAEDAGAPEWAQTAAGLAGGLGAGALAYAPRVAPSAIGARAVGRYLAREAAPYTESGGREIARQRLQELAGGEERALELARRVSPDNPLGLSPAQQTGDPNLIGVERAAMETDPITREAVDLQRTRSQEAAERLMRETGGNPGDAVAFVEQRRQEARDFLGNIVQQAQRTADSRRPQAQRPDFENSAAVADELRKAEGVALQREKELWDAVPKGAQVGTTRTRQTALEAIATVPRAQRNDIPRVVQELLGEGANNGFGEFETVAEMHGLYSELRRIARSAMAGNDQNKNMARISNQIADAILDDLGANAGLGEVGRTVDTARAFSREMHETFDQGTVGRLLKRTLDGDEQVNPQLTLDRMVGRPGAAGRVGVEEIQRAADTDITQAAIEDYMIGRFNRAAFGPDGRYQERQAQTFLRDNAATIEQFPYLRDSLQDAIAAQSRATRTASRADDALGRMDNPRLSATARFLDGPPEEAAQRIIRSRDPAQTAREIVRTAAKDSTGKALDGLKGAFSAQLIASASRPRGEGVALSGQALADSLRDPRMLAAMRQVFTQGEVNRLRTVGSELAKLEAARQGGADIGSLTQAKPNKVLEFVLRVYAARQGAQAGQGSGASLQIAGMASERMKRILGSLTNDRAEAILIASVQDPELFRTLLMTPGSVKVEQRIANRLAPYIAGTAAAEANEE